MKLEQQRIKLAEWDGWKFKLGPNASGWRNSDGELSPLPDYLSDLNAVHELEKKLLVGYEDDPGGCELWSDYQTALILTAPAYLSNHATAAQRCEALLKTIGLWEESE